MALREVLKNYTFEQQRQVINNIGQDLGDLSLLNTAQTDIVSAINAIGNSLDPTSGLLLNGTTDPENTTGTNGDFYINTTTEELFGPKENNVWPTEPINFKGLLFGETNPSPSDGVLGSFYIKTTTQDLFGPKTESGWSLTATSLSPQLLSGSGEPSSSLGKNNDYYLDLTSKDLYGPKTEGDWTEPISLSEQFLSGSGSPLSTLGKINDFYIDTTSRNLYGPKTSGGWGIPIPLSEEEVGTVIFVNRNGSDDRNGLSVRNSVKTLKKACEIARNTNGNVTIRMFSGEYYEDNPIYVPKGTSIVGDNLRETIVRPLNEGEDFLWVTSGSYINYLVFRDNYGDVSNPSDASRGVGILNTGADREISPTETVINLFPGHTLKRVDGIFKDGANILTFRRQEIIDYAFNQMILEYPDLVIPDGIEQGGEATCKRDIGYFVDGLINDLKYGGNMHSVDVGQSYFDALGNLDHIVSEFEETKYAFNRASFAAKAYVQDAATVNSNPEFVEDYGTIIEGDCSNVVTNIDNLTSIVISILDGNDAPRINPGPGYVLVNQEWMEVDDLDGNVLTIKTRNINNPLTGEQALVEPARHISGSVITQGARTWRYAIAYPDQGGIICKGRVSLQTSTSLVTGTNTKFTEQCFAGGFIRFDDLDSNPSNDTTYKILSVTNDTELVLVTTPTANLSDRKFRFIPPKERIFLSPYTQNCSAISVLGNSYSEVINGIETYDARKTRAGGILVDGDQLEPNTPIKSMVCDAFTQVVSGGIGFHLKNDGYAQLVSVFEVFEDVGVLCENGAYTSITNSATNFGNEGLKAIGYSNNPYPFFIGNVSEINNLTKTNFNSSPSNIITTTFEEENTKVRMFVRVSSTDIGKFEPNQSLNIDLHILPNPASSAAITALQSYINGTALEVNRIVLSDNIVEILLDISWNSEYETLSGSQTGEMVVTGGATYTEIEITGFDAKALPNYVIKFPTINLPPHPSGVEYVVDIVSRFEEDTDITVLTTQPKIPDSDLGLIVSNVAIQLRAPSTVNSSGHTFEYVGAGINYTALPQNGGRSRAEFQSVESSSGKSYVSATDQDGNFFVGPYFKVDLRTGKATFSGAVALGVLDELQLKASPGVPIYEFSTDDTLGGGTGSKNTALPTQKAVRDYINKPSVLGNLIGLNKTTSRAPGQLVLLDSNGRINSELLPPANPVNVFTVANEEERLGLTSAIPGDVAYQTDTEIAYILLDEPANNPDNWNVFSGTNINASNIVSGIISPARLGTGIANESVFLSGISKYSPLTQGLIPSTNSPVLISGNRLNVLKTGNTTNVSSAVWDGNVLKATVTTTTTHGLTNNQWVEVESIFPYGYNGFFQVTVTTPTSFTYDLASDPGEYVSEGFVTSGVKYDAGFTELDIRRASFFSGQTSGSSDVGVVKYDWRTFEIDPSSVLALREKGVTLGKLENIKRRTLLGNNEFPTQSNDEGNVLELGLGEDVEQVTVFNVSLLNGQYRIVDRIIDKNLGTLPTLQLVPGKSYKLNLSVAGEPFFITTEPKDILEPLETVPSSNYTDGIRVTNRESGILYFTVPFDAPTILYYQSGNTEDNYGIIIVGSYEKPGVDFITAYAPHVIDSFDKDKTNTCKYLIQVTENEEGLRVHSTEIMLVHDNVDVLITEYATLVSDVYLGSFSAEINNNEVRLLFTANNLLTTANLKVKVIKTQMF